MLSVEEMVELGMSAEAIQNAVAAKVADLTKTATPAKNAKVVAIGSRLANTGVLSTEDAVSLTIELLKTKMPAVAEMIEEIGGIEAEDVKSMADELDKNLAMYNSVLKLAIMTGFDVKKDAGAGDLGDLLKKFGKFK